MSARGDYRAIYTVLWNGPDWQALPPEPRLVWLALKGNCGPTGIACLPAVEHQVSRWTGLDVSAVSRAFAILQTQGWMVSASDVVWVRGGITYEPSRHVGNANHRAAARDHVAGLPHVPIVAAFVREHPDWFPAEEAQPVIPWAFSDTRPAPKLLGAGYAPDGMGDRIGDRKSNTETETETEDGVTTGDAGASQQAGGVPRPTPGRPARRKVQPQAGGDPPPAPPTPTWVQAVHDALLEFPKIHQPHGKIGGVLSAVVKATAATPEQMREAVRDYDAHLYSHGKRPFVLAHFAAELPKLLAMQGQPMGDGFGGATERGRYLLGAQA